MLLILLFRAVKTGAYLLSEIDENDDTNKTPNTGVASVGQGNLFGGISVTTAVLWVNKAKYK